MMPRSTAAGAVLAGCVLLGPGLLAPFAASGEPLKLGAPPRPRPAPPMPAPGHGVPHRPAPEAYTFVDPLSRPTETGRVGVAVWGAPGASSSQRGPGDPDSVGWVGAGIAVEWGGTPRRATPN